MSSAEIFTLKLAGGLLMWMLPLYLHVNKKSNDNDDDDDDMQSVKSIKHICIKMALFFS